MPSLSLKAAHKLMDSFEGRITAAHDALTEFRGKHTVLIPESTEDVARALQLARAADLRVFVRSGQSVANDDVTKAKASDPQAAIISMEVLRDVEVNGTVITAGAAATMADVADTLKETKLFLPLSDNPAQSVASAVLSMPSSPFLRSDVGSGSLRDALIEAEVIPTDGTGAGRAKTVRNKALQDLLAGDRTSVITQLVFDTAKSQARESNRWARVWMTNYASTQFAELCDTLFAGNLVPAGVDLSLRVTSSAYGMKLVLIRATGHGDADQEATSQLVEGELTRRKLRVLGTSRGVDAGSSVAAWVNAGPGAALPDEAVRRFGSNGIPRPYAKIRDKFIEGIDFAIGDDPVTKRERADGVRAWAELQLTQDGNVLVRAEISETRAESDALKSAHRLMNAATPADKASAAIAEEAQVRRDPLRTILRGAEILPSLIPTLGFDLLGSTRTARNLIPGFKGDVFDAASGSQYRRAIKQYAVSSYKPNVIAARMTPQYVAQPVDAADVATAVKFAAANNFKVVTRSGGHQYCGLSSGGSNTLLLDVKRLSNVKFFPTSGTPTQVTVGPGIALRVLSKLLRDKQVVIPHGECPLVRIGGHVQTGGIGHQLRSLGATLDHVRSFKMVTRDPNAPGVDAFAEHQFNRPQANGTALSDEIFRAVLGGGPGSWGVLTEITFDLVPDTKYPNSQGYSKTYLYEKSAFSAAMTQLRLWVEQQANGTLPDGVDFFLSVISDDFVQLRPEALLIEMMSRTKAGASLLKGVVDAVNQQVSLAGEVVSVLASPLAGPAPLSVIADDGVRDIGLFGMPCSGREFDLPYKKSLHITKSVFTQVFCDKFVDLVDSAMNEEGLKVVVQTVVGGGEFKGNAKNNTTRMQRRDALLQLVFDVFYEPGFENRAEYYQQQMKNLLPLYSKGADIRMAWGTFEDPGTQGTQLDMSRKDVQNLYYDSPDVYAELKRLKTTIDPQDVFHTSFTVQ